MTNQRLPSGIYLQIYRDALPGRNQGERVKSLCEYMGDVNDASKRGLAAVNGVVLHGFPRELIRNWEAYSKPLRDAGWMTLASWGADGSQDNDGSRLTAQEKGDCIGEVLSRTSCSAGLVDAEGQWDSKKDAQDDMDESGALAMMKSIRRKAPTKFLGDQPWFAIDSHGELRRTPKPIESGGVFAGFPVDEFAVDINWRRFRQAYCNNFTRQFGNLRYSKVFSWMDRDWNRIAPAMAAAGLTRDLGVTIQGYGWRLFDEVDCMLREIVTKGNEIVVWCDPLPDLTTRKAMFIVSRLIEEGYACPGLDPRTIVLSYQREYNTRTGRKYNLSVDGLAGEMVYQSMQ